MDKNELLKYLICEIDLIMHGKDYRFENEDGTWYSRESCKNLTNEEVFEELKSELRQLAKIEDDFADLEAKLAESEKELDRYAELFGMKGKDFYVVEKTEYEKMKQGVKEIVDQLKQQLAELEEQDIVYHNQTAIEELEKVIKLTKEMDYLDNPEFYNNDFATWGFDIACKLIREQINKQIDELKGEK